VLDKLFFHSHSLQFLPELHLSLLWQPILSIVFISIMHTPIFICLITHTRQITLIRIIHCDDPFHLSYRSQRRWCGYYPLRVGFWRVGCGEGRYVCLGSLRGHFAIGRAAVVHVNGFYREGWMVRGRC